MTGRLDPPRSRRRGRTVLAGAVAVAGLSMLVVPLSDMTIADSPDAAAATPALPQTTPHGRDDEDRGIPVSGARVVQVAAEERGHPYKYGADGPLAFDCSGLTQQVYQQLGINLPHNSAAQYRAVEHVAKSDMRLGDLVFYYDDGGIYHVGIYAGNKQIWAAGSPGEVVRRHHIWTDKYVVGRP
jgi:cell wall-associated NlpC family hydrolase